MLQRGMGAKDVGFELPEEEGEVSGTSKRLGSCASSGT